MLQCSIPTGEVSKARARVGLHGGLSPLERHECPQNDLIPASCGSTTACMSSSWPCIRTPSPMSSCPEARASPRAWASFSPSSQGFGADRWLKRADCAPHASFRQAEGSVARQLAPVDREGGEQPRRRGPEAAEEG